MSCVGHFVFTLGQWSAILLNQIPWLYACMNVHMCCMYVCTCSNELVMVHEFHQMSSYPPSACSQVINTSPVVHVVIAHVTHTLYTEKSLHELSPRHVKYTVYDH